MFKLTKYLFVKIIIFLVLCDKNFGETVISNNTYDIPPKGQLNFTGLSIYFGYPAEEHQVITEDGYILTIFHIPGHLGPVLLHHGVVDSSDAFIIRGNISLAINLAAAGYDVWVSNQRGNSYSRKHVTLNPDTDKAFWNFTLHELGRYDLPAVIDYILESTGATKLIAIAHSQGNAQFYILASTRPEYNDKVKVLIALAPVAYLHHVRYPIRFLVDVVPALNLFLLATGQEELLRDHAALKTLVLNICYYIPLRYDICGLAFFESTVGFDSSELEKAFYEIVLWYFPRATSRMNLMHLVQLVNGKKFAPYNYGRVKNLEIYGNETAPEYNLADVTIPVELLVGKNDKLATEEDAKLLWKSLPNAKFTLLPRETMNHADFMFGKNLDKYLLPIIFDILKNLKE